jgi:hypothetical protein
MGKTKTGTVAKYGLDIIKLVLNHFFFFFHFSFIIHMCIQGLVYFSPLLVLNLNPK